MWYLSYTPPLIKTVNGEDVMVYYPKKKADLLAKSFFPLSPDIDLNNTKNFWYLEPLSVPDITKAETLTVIT